MEQIFILKENRNKIESPSDLFKNIKKININYKQENFLIFCLDTQNKIIHKEVLFKGGLNACLIDPKTIFRIALIKNSNNIIIAHNHPSNNLKPSSDDKIIYSKLKDAGTIIDIGVLDSVIFNKKEFFSLNDNEI